MSEQDVVIGVVLEEACLSIDQLAGACAVSSEWVVRRVEEGMLAAAGTNQNDWRFASRELVRARRMRSFERDFDATPELAALVADLLDELAELRARLGESP